MRAGIYLVALLLAAQAAASTVVSGPTFNSLAYCSGTKATYFVQGTVSVSSTGYVGDVSPNFVTHIVPPALPTCTGGGPQWSDAQIVLSGFKMNQSEGPNKIPVRSLSVSANRVSYNAVTHDLTWNLGTSWAPNQGAGSPVYVEAIVGIIAINGQAVRSALVQDSISCTNSAGCSAVKTSSATFNTLFQFAGASMSGFSVATNVGTSGFGLNDVYVDTSATAAGAAPGTWSPAISCLFAGGGGATGTTCSANLVAVAGATAELVPLTQTDSLTPSPPTDFVSVKTTPYPGPTHGNICGLEAFRLTFSAGYFSSLWSIWAGAHRSDCGYDPGPAFRMQWYGNFGDTPPTSPPPPPWSPPYGWGTHQYTGSITVNGMILR